MTEKTTYTAGFREQALQKVLARGRRTVAAIADELNVNVWTLKNWMKAKRVSVVEQTVSKRPHDRKPAERLALLLEGHGLSDEALYAFCRAQGIFPQHLQQWRAEFEAGSPKVRQDVAALRELKEANKALTRELQRKDKALAEAAALLVLQKKYQALWEEKDA